MFLRIDNACINMAQWVVRQCELYTSLTRVRIVSGVISTYGMIFIAFTIAGIIASVYFWPPFFIPVLLVSIAAFFVQKIRWGILADQVRSANMHFLPKEIITRVSIRFSCMILLLIVPCVIFPFTCDALASLWDEHRASALFLGSIMLLLSGIFITDLVIEYLFCTTSLPPGEKERKKKERETRVMQPIAT